MCSRSSGGMPGPVSATMTSTVLPLGAAIHVHLALTTGVFERIVEQYKEELLQVIHIAMDQHAVQAIETRTDQRSAVTHRSPLTAGVCEDIDRCSRLPELLRAAPFALWIWIYVSVALSTFNRGR